MNSSLVFTPGCDWRIDRHILLVEYETVTGELTSKRFDLSAETEYIVVDGYKMLSFDEISKPEAKLHYSIRRIVYFEKECSSMVAFARGCRQNRLLIPTRIEFDTVIHVPKESPNVDSDRVEMINQRIARDMLNSTYGIVSRDWADVLADSARYIYMQQSRRSGKTLWLSNIAKSIEEDARNDAIERWLKSTPIKPLPLGEHSKVEMEEMKMADKTRFDMYKPKISKVIFNEPATIVFWTDGTKTIVKCGENDDFDPEKGIAMCCMKKLLGTNKTGSNYLDDVKNYIQKWEEDNAVENVWTKLFCELFKMTGEDLVNTDAMDIPEETENPGLTDEALKEVAEGGENNDEA